MYILSSKICAARIFAQDHSFNKYDKIVMLDKNEDQSSKKKPM